MVDWCRIGQEMGSSPRQEMVKVAQSKARNWRKVKKNEEIIRSKAEKAANAAKNAKTAILRKLTVKKRPIWPPKRRKTPEKWTFSGSGSLRLCHKVIFD